MVHPITVIRLHIGYMYMVSKLEMCPQDTDAPAKCAITLKKAHNSVKNQWIVTQIELDMCFDIIYQHTKFELNRCSLSKVIEQTPNFDNGRTDERTHTRMDRGNT